MNLMSTKSICVVKKQSKTVLRAFKERNECVAQNTVKFSSVEQSDRAYNTLLLQLEQVYKHGLEVKAVARLQLLYGLRISEVLSIKGSNIDRFGAIWIEGKKKSNPRQVVDTELVQFYLSRRLLGNGLIFDFDRFFIHRIYKSCGINHTADKSGKNLTTHYMRHLYVKRLSSQTDNLNDIASVVGHKSKSNTKGYLNSKIK